jgi:3-hydroxyisobutyrate dehydrogenase-like beta-hydroxyacid dehydrogenase
MNKSIGLIGVGLMGHGIARNVLKHGFPLTVQDHPGNQPLDELLAAGARVRQSAAQVAADTDVIILCVTGSPQVEAVLTGAGGVLETLRPGTVVIDCSTSIPSSTEKMAAAVQAKGGRFLDAPMTRLAKHAHEGTLNLLVGGDPAVLEEVRPLLDSFSENITHVGPVAAGHRMKLLHNYVSLGFMALLAEVTAHAELTGVEPAVLVDVLAKGGGAGTALQRMSPFILTHDPSDVPFFIANAAKDLNYYCTTAAESGASRDIAEAVAKTLDAVVTSGHGQAYVPELAALLKPGAGSS